MERLWSVYHKEIPPFLREFSATPPMERLMEVMVDVPRKRFNLPMGEDFSIWDLDTEYEIDPDDFVSLGKATTFNGWKVFGRCKATVCDGRVVYKEEV